jgi:hypothetical protein
MVACVVKVVLGPDTQWEIEKLADIFNALFQKHRTPGFQGFTFLFAYETGEYLGVSYFDTKEHALAAVQKYAPLFGEMVKHGYQWKPTVELFEVYEPKPIDLDV